MLERSGASRQGIRCTLPIETRRRIGSSLAVPVLLFLHWRRLLARLESQERPRAHLLLLGYKDPFQPSPLTPTPHFTSTHARVCTHTHIVPPSGGHRNGDNFPVCSCGHMCVPILSPFSLLPGHLAEQEGSQCMASDMELTEKSV